MGCSSGPDIIEDGLVLCLDAASKRSYPGTGTVWTDLKGENSGTLTNGPAFDAGNGGSFVFDATNERVEFTDLGLSFSDFSIHAMIKPHSNDGLYDAVISATLGSNNDYQYGLNWDLGSGSSGSFNTMNLEISRAFGGFYNRDVFTSDIPFYTWTHIALSVDSVGNTYKVYVNGVQNYTNTYNGSITHFDRVTLGQRFYSGSYLGSSSFKGNIACVSIYNRALSADEIRRNYLSTKERFV